MNGAITDTPYEPDDELAELLKEVDEKVRINYTDTSQFEIAGQFPAQKMDYIVTFDDFELKGYETQSPVGNMMSLEGHLGLAAAYALASAKMHGEISQAYMDEGPPAEPFGDPYQDLSVEWYPEVARKAGIPEQRLENRVVDLDAEVIDIETLEDWARHWLSKGR